MSETDKLFRIKEVAELLGVSTRTVYRRIWSNELPAVKIGGLYYIRQSDLDKTIQQALPKSTLSHQKLLNVGPASRSFAILNKTPSAAAQPAVWN